LSLLIVINFDLFPHQTMGIVTAPRSVSDATRFTATTPHASSKTVTPEPGVASRFSAPSSAPQSQGPQRVGGQGSSGRGGPRGPTTETPEQRVARLRAAHLRAKSANVSKMDRVVAVGRRVFDSAHKITVVGLIAFTGKLPPPPALLNPQRRIIGGVEELALTFPLSTQWWRP
jgi:hypothetical protein